MVHEQEVVLFNLVAHEEENEGEKGAYGHRDGEHERHAHDSESEGLVVSKLEKPVIFVGSVLHPVIKNKEALPAKVRDIKHLDAIGDEYDLH